MLEQHTILGGKVHDYKRPNSGLCNAQAILWTKIDAPARRKRASLAKNCRTSVEMIEKYYAAHIKTSLDAAAINVMRPKKKKIQMLVA